MSDEFAPPIVFISYSHDSQEHKQWVLGLAQRLRGEGIEVIIDEWDLRYGDDVAAFMVNAVKRAHRVLMICTEAYIQKADEGKGGVGYEALIVTSELIQNIGTQKFVPVIRQASAPLQLPAKLGARMAANLSHYVATPDENFRKIVAEIRREPPVTKPPLGMPIPVATPLPAGSLDVTSEAKTNPEEAFEQASRIARAGDMSRWRRLIASHRAGASRKILEWRKNAEQTGSLKKSDLPRLLTEALGAYQPLFATALAAIESEQPRFNQQGELIYDLLDPKDWNRGGLVVINNVPDAAGWVFQALAGAMLVYTRQTELALDLATQRIPDKHSERSAPLYLTSRLIGWPESLGRSCATAWHFLNDLPIHFPWVEKAFGGVDAFKQSLAGYHLLLSWLDYLETLRAGEQDALTARSLIPNMPPVFLGEESLSRGILFVLEGREPLKRFISKRGISVEAHERYWPDWLACLEQWIGRTFHGSGRLPNRCTVVNFASDISR
jgi:hypothetical protein